MPFVLLSILAVLVTLGILAAVTLFLALEWLGYRRQRQFRERGVTADAWIESVTLDEGMWAIAYRFQDRRMQEQVGLDFLDANRNDLPIEGSKIRIVYLPEQPWVSGLAQTWLGSRTAVR
ncbi:MAG: hypothetical protein SNJ82_11710 [Gemmataceae bacterium]